MRTGAVILCGGRSTRMGRDKAALPFGPETMLERVVRLLSQAVDPGRIVVVAAAGQGLPLLPAAVQVVHDRRPECGPLEGLAAGLSALVGAADAAFATSCDAPRLVPAFVTRMLGRLGDAEIAVPQEGERAHPLAAVYRLSVLAAIERQLDADRRSLQALLSLASVRTERIPVSELVDVDPALATLTNVNSPESYHAALRAAGCRADGTS